MLPMGYHLLGQSGLGLVLRYKINNTLQIYEQ